MRFLVHDPESTHKKLLLNPIRALEYAKAVESYVSVYSDHVLHTTTFRLGTTFRLLTTPHRRTQPGQPLF
jgi:hypothetical protein